MASDYIYVVWLDEEEVFCPYNVECSSTPIGFFDIPDEAHEALIEIINNDTESFPPECTKPIKEGNDWAFRAVFDDSFRRTIRITEEAKNHILNRTEDEEVIKWLN